MSSTRLIEYLEGLTLGDGDLDGQQLRVLPWERRFLAGAFGAGKRGSAGLSVARGNGTASTAPRGWWPTA